MVRKCAWPLGVRVETMNGFLIYGSEMRTAMIYFLFAFPLLDMKERDDKDGYKLVIEVIILNALKTAISVAYILSMKMDQRWNTRTLYLQ